MTTALNQMKQWGQNLVSSLPGNKEKMESDPILMKCNEKLNELLQELNAIKRQFCNYAEQQVNATEASVTLSKTIHMFYAQANHPGRAESVNAYKQVQEDIATNAVKTFHIDVESGLLTQIAIWVENIKHLKAQIEGGKRARIAAFHTQHRLQSLKQELTRKTQQLNNAGGSIFAGISNNNTANKEQELDHLKYKIEETAHVQESLAEDFINVRNAVERQVKSLMNQRFVHFDRIYVQILECQQRFYEHAQQQSKRFQRDVEFYWNQNSSRPKQCPQNPPPFAPEKAAQLNQNKNKSSSSSVAEGDLNNKPPVNTKRVHRRQPSPGKMRTEQIPKQPMTTSSAPALAPVSASAAAVPAPAMENLFEFPNNNNNEQSLPEVQPTLNESDSNLWNFLSNNKTPTPMNEGFFAMFEEEPAPKKNPSPIHPKNNNNTNINNNHNNNNYIDTNFPLTQKQGNVNVPKVFKLSAAAQARVDAVVKERVDFVNHLQDKENAEILIREQAIEQYGPQLKEWEFDKTVRRNIRTLLCKLTDVLPAHLGWNPLTVAQLLNASQIKKAYFKAVRIVHPDKAMHRNDSVQVRVRCERIFQALDCAYKTEYQSK